MNTELLETMQRAITAVGTIGLIGFCLYVLRTNRGA